MCKYCEYEQARPIISVMLENETTDIYVDFTYGCPTMAMKTVLGLCSTLHAKRIDYCPMCGRDLRKEAADD